MRCSAAAVARSSRACCLILCSEARPKQGVIRCQWLWPIRQDTHVGTSRTRDPAVAYQHNLGANRQSHGAQHARCRCNGDDRHAAAGWHGGCCDARERRGRQGSTISTQQPASQHKASCRPLKLGPLEQAQAAHPSGQEGRAAAATRRAAGAAGAATAATAGGRGQAMRACAARLGAVRCAAHRQGRQWRQRAQHCRRQGWDGWERRGGPRRWRGWWRRQGGQGGQRREWWKGRKGWERGLAWQRRDGRDGQGWPRRWRWLLRRRRVGWEGRRCPPGQRRHGRGGWAWCGGPWCWAGRWWHRRTGR